MKWPRDAGRDLRPLVVLLIPTVVLFWEIILAGRVLFWGVPLLQFVPWYQAVRSAILSGELPLWNPLVGGGAPLLANYQSAVFYPPNWLHLVMEPARAMSLLMVAHVLWAGVGMWVYARAIGLRSLARLVSALSLMLSGYLISRLGFPSIGSTLPWAPWLLYGVERSLARPGWRSSALLGTLIGLMLLAGHAQTAFYTGLMVTGYLIVRAWSRPRSAAGGFFRPLVATGRFLAAGLIGCALATVQLLPTAELLQASQRAGGVEAESAMTYSLWPLRVLSLIAPRFFGHPGTGNYWGYCCNYWEDNGYIGVLGLLLALGAVVAWMRWRLSRTRADVMLRGVPLAQTIVPYFGIVAVLSLVLAFGIHTPLYPWVFDHVPGFGQFQAPARLLCLWTVGMAVLAGVGTELWRPNAAVGRLARYAVTVGLALLIAAAAVGGFLTEQTATFRLGTAQLGSALVAIGALALLQPRGSDLARHLRWSAAVLVLVAADLVWANWGAHPTAERWLYTRATESGKQLQAAGERGSTFYPSTDEYFVTFERYLSFRTFAPAADGGRPGEVSTERWFGMREALIPNAGMLDGLPALNNFDPFRPARHELLLETINAASGQEQIKLLQMAGVSVLITASGAPSELRPIHSNSDVTFYRVPDPLPRAYIVYQAVVAADLDSAQAAVAGRDFDAHDTVVVETDASVAQHQLPMTAVALTTRLGSATIRASLPEDGILVLLDSHYPGWQATVDGRPAEILPANLAFKAVRVPAGEHVVEFRYRPMPMTIGVTISLLTVALIGLLMVANYLRNRRGHAR